MHDWLTIEFVLAALLVTSFTCNGLLALWAATSTRHWFVRATIALAVLSLPLLVRAYEPFLTFMLQFAFVLGSAALWQWQSEWRGHLNSFVSLHESNRSSVFRFSLSTLLLVAAVACISTAIATRVITNFPRQNFEAWTTIAVIGVVSGSAVLIGAWMCVMSHNWWAWLIGIVSCLLLAAPLVWTDWLVLSFTWLGDWPPDMVEVQRAASAFGGLVIPNTARIWYGIVPAVSILTGIVLLIAQFGRAASERSRQVNDCVQGEMFATSLIRRSATITLIILLGLFPTYVLWRLLNPPELPHVTVPVPNGFDEIVAAGKAFETSQILSFTIEPKSTDELAAEVAKYRAAYQQLRLGLSQKTQADIWPPIADRRSDANRHLTEVQRVRAAMRALSREADLAQEQHRYTDAANISLETMRLGHSYASAGIFRHLLIGLAIEGSGHFSLYRAIDHLDMAECRRLIAELKSLDDMREPFDLVQGRDRIWEQNAYGWHHKAGWVLYDVVGTNTATYNRARNQPYRRTQAVLRLLIVELAIRAYQFEHNTLPSKLNELTPEYISAVPDDPFDPDGGHLKYRRARDAYVLYSNGPDEIDGGGERLTMSLSYAEHGDLSLGGELSPPEEPSEEPAKDESQPDDSGITD